MTLAFTWLLGLVGFVAQVLLAAFSYAILPLSKWEPLTWKPLRVAAAWLGAGSVVDGLRLVAQTLVTSRDDPAARLAWAARDGIWLSREGLLWGLGGLAGMVVVTLALRTREANVRRFFYLSAHVVL